MSAVASNVAPHRLEMRGIGKSFGGVAVLSDVDLLVEPGEVLALLGANGAGKSTLMKILTGLYERDAGTIRIDGTAVSFFDPRAALAAGVRLLPQEISIMPDMTVAENISLADLPLRRGPGFRVDDAAMRRKATALLDELGFGAIDPNLAAGKLSVAEQRIVEIARALAGEARILVVDEPTAALTEQETRLIFRLIRRLKERSVSIIYISHYLREIFEIADRIAVLRDGRNAGEFVTSAASRADVLSAMLGGAAGDLYDVAARGGAERSAVLSVEDMSVPGRLSDVSFSVDRGEIVGVFGLVGSGVEVLGRAIYGALGPVVEGGIRIAGLPYRPRSPRHAKEVGIGFVAADRKREGIIGDLTVRENMVAAFPDRYARGLFVSRDAEAAQSRRWIELLGIRARGPEQIMRTLSGGNQQKVCVARWLVEGVTLLILEEPTRGVDVGARREIYAELRALADRGMAVLVLSSDVEEVAGLSDRSIVIDRGRLVGRFERGTAPTRLMAATAVDPAFAGG
ncbi:MAG: sugar ABC transporter ATP-binding protein [Methylobacteriaceae bacterium]|nr:sugar ABC transporter ATP-binding protein [Methylobacteriaceae bacterium]